MANSGIEDILIGESYKTTKKKSKAPIIIFIILLIILVALALGYFYINQDTTSEKSQFSKSILNACTRKLSDNDFYSTIFERILQENSEITTNITVSSTEEIEELQGIDVNNFDFELTSQNDLDQKNFYGELAVKYSGNDFLNFKGIINDNKFAIISDEIVNKYVGVKAQNFNDIFNSDIDLNFIYEFINAEEIDLTEDEKKNYLENYYNNIYNQISAEKFSKKENIVITKNTDYIDVTAYELTLSQSELEDIIVNILTELKDDDKLLTSIISKEIVELDLSASDEEESKEELDTGDEDSSTTLQLVPVSEVNFQTAEEINTDDENQSDEVEINEEINEEEITNEETVEEENTQDEIGLILETNNEEDFSNNEFTTNDLIKILLGKKINVSKDKIIEKIDEYIENLEGSGLTITVYVSDEKTEKISCKLPNEDELDIQFLEDTDKESTIEITYLYSDSLYTEGYSINIDEVHNSASSSIKIVKNYIEDEVINKKVSLSIQTDGTKNANTISNDIVFTISTNSDETKIVAENKLKFLSESLILEKLTDENSVFLDDMQIEERDSTIQAIKDKINLVLEEKKVNLNLIDLNSRNSIVENLNNTTSNNYLLIKNTLENRINELKNEAEENGEEFSIQNLNDLSIEGFEVTTNVDEEKAVVVIDVYTFIIDKDFNISDN